MNKLIEFHLFELKQNITLSKFFTIAVLIALIFIMHTLSLAENNELWTAISMRLYYIPILYAVIFLGFITSTGVSIIAAIAHLFTMFSSEHHVHTVMLEHLVETPFLVVLGLTAGFLRDFLLFEKNKKNEIVDLFGKYVSPQVVDDIINKKIKTEGEEKEVTILFCDIKNFTKLAERLNPIDLILLLNKFFIEMVEIILRNDGFLDKFIGDAMMVVFGIPEAKSKDRELAVKVAVEMLKRLKQLNDESYFGNEILEITIGIHSGKVVAGNVGSTERKVYTIIGDNVNLASRIQSLNKYYNSCLLITDSVYQGIKEQDFKLREIDSVRVKGKALPCVIFEVYSELDAEEIKNKEKNLINFMNALMYYKSGDFQQAKIFFDDAYKQSPNDFLCKLYLERIKNLSESEVKDWDGIYDFKSK
ncbi:adenylate/guanylate cyclase domain-containing protein [Leptospira vanthielii]|uniref:Adenylate/guanylate cyclase catalytic domain protein n=1 Tax=Leptospira vanthielii serovar Holland str. Waz Holland = ATCC 700522 TaxID=1218591 RepID=N1W303_9LEPT|nr:adenylate/guanylate cyclase domain-containing protein [Leptospira vanthielii]EMY70599.1 adenylate/guanylate cyclase catalytic domain protein [Leptospira vanthielii serovar Holland str. Waz Holland = ATCC 700522]